MRTFFAYFVIIVPCVVYNFYCFYKKEPNSGIDFLQVINSFLIGIVFYNIGIRIKNKGKEK